jgi:F-type H+-transporting ATPase subunit gamma
MYVAFNAFESAISFIPTIKQILPIALDLEEQAEIKKELHYSFLFQPNPEDILNSLIPLSYINDIFLCSLEATASEHGARMTAMENATSNCEEEVKSITLKMNKLRQAAITRELIEVISGAESLS